LSYKIQIPEGLSKEEKKQVFEKYRSLVEELGSVLSEDEKLFVGNLLLDCHFEIEPEPSEQEINELKTATRELFEKALKLEKEIGDSTNSTRVKYYTIDRARKLEARDLVIESLESFTPEEIETELEYCGFDELVNDGYGTEALDTLIKLEDASVLVGRVSKIMPAILSTKDQVQIDRTLSVLKESNAEMLASRKEGDSKISGSISEAILLLVMDGRIDSARELIDEFSGNCSFDYVRDRYDYFDDEDRPSARDVLLELIKSDNPTNIQLAQSLFSSTRGMISSEEFKQDINEYPALDSMLSSRAENIAKELESSPSASEFSRNLVSLLDITVRMDRDLPDGSLEIINM
jgi:hypothetical protein